MSAVQDRGQAGLAGRVHVDDLRRNWRRIAVAAGYVALLVSLATIIVSFSGWVLVVLAALAAGLLAFDRRLGPLPAAMLVMIAIPVGRGSEVGLAELAGYPIRPHDAAAIIGAALALPRAIDVLLRRPGTLVTPAIVPFSVFLGLGILALAIGLLGENALRDIVRDGRWWALYGIGLLALVTSVSRAAIVRALLWGMTLYATVIMIGMLLPEFDGGLKLGAYYYDQRMRLHYGQAIFLIPAAAFAAVRAVRRPIPWLAIVALLAAATSITLTRALIAAVALVVIVAIALAALRIVRAGSAGRAAASLRRVALPSAAVALALAIGMAVGVGAYEAGTRIWSGSGSSNGPSEDRPVINASDRIVGREGTDFDAQGGGRLASYARAFSETSQAPVLGHGMGELTYVDWTWGEFQGHTRNSQPGVDNAYLTVGLKAGAIGVAALGLLLLWPLRRFVAVPRRRIWTWYGPAWLGVLGLSLVESFAVSGYAPLALSLLVAVPLLGAPASQPASEPTRSAGD